MNSSNMSFEIMHEKSHWDVVVRPGCHTRSHVDVPGIRSFTIAVSSS